MAVLGDHVGCPTEQVNLCKHQTCYTISLTLLPYSPFQLFKILSFDFLSPFDLLLLEGVVV